MLCVILNKDVKSLVMVLCLRENTEFNRRKILLEEIMYKRRYVPLLITIVFFILLSGYAKDETVDSTGNLSVSVSDTQEPKEINLEEANGEIAEKKASEGEEFNETATEGILE